MLELEFSRYIAGFSLSALKAVLDIKINNNNILVMTIDITKYNFINKLKELPFVEAIYLYGSRARGDNSQKADIDLAILCPNADSFEWYNIMDIIENADTLLEIDCLRLDEQKDKKMLENINRDKVIIYEK